MPIAAAAKYWGQREKYRNALATIEKIEDDSIRGALHRALTAHVRGQFRSISDALTKRIGFRLTCLPEGHLEPFQIEHAVPLKLIHNRILGIRTNNSVDPETYGIFPEKEDIESYVSAFMVGVLVTPQQHKLLEPQSMHGEWNWLTDMEPWEWRDLSLNGWNYNERPAWLRLIMNRYEHVTPPEGPLHYRPTSEEERQYFQNPVRRIRRRK